MPSTLVIVPTVSLPKKSNKPSSLTNASILEADINNNKKPLSSPKKSISSPSTSKRQRKPKTKQKVLSTTDDTSSPSSSSSQTESDDTDKSTNTQKRQQQQQRRRRHPKKANAQPKLQENMPPPSLPVNMKRRRRSNSAVIYAGPHFMNDAPAPSSLPLPGALVTPTQSVSLHQKQPVQQEKQHQLALPQLLQHRPTLYERSLAGDYMDSKLLSSHKSYLMDPISEIQEKLRTMLKIQA